jgi:hypothetical protein
MLSHFRSLEPLYYSTWILSLFPSPSTLRGGIVSYISILVAVMMLLYWTWPFFSRNMYVGMFISLYCTLEPTSILILYYIEASFFLTCLDHLYHAHLPIIFMRYLDENGYAHLLSIEILYTCHLLTLLLTGGSP